MAKLLGVVCSSHGIMSFQGICECAKKQKCLGCNCGEDKPEAWLDDNIIVDGAANLPIREVMFGDLATSREKGIVDVAPVKCVDTIIS